MISPAQRLLGGMAPPTEIIHRMFSGMDTFSAVAAQPGVTTSGGVSGRGRRRRRIIIEEPDLVVWPEEAPSPGIPTIPHPGHPLLPHLVTSEESRSERRMRRRREEVLLAAIGAFRK